MLKLVNISTFADGQGQGGWPPTLSHLMVILLKGRFLRPPPLKDIPTFYKYPLYNFKDGYEILIALIMISKTKSA